MAVTFPPNQFLHQFWADQSKTFNFEAFGVEVCQNQTSLLLMSRMLEEYRPDVIIEIGTYTGGLSILLGQYGFLRGIDVHTFDIVDKRQNTEIFTLLDIDFHMDDCFSAESDAYIRQLIAKSTRALVICDGGDKIREFNYYSDIIRRGDLICCHDYSPSKAVFDQHVYLKWWGWCEITDADIAAAVARNQLRMPHPELSVAAAMGWYLK